MPAPSPNLSKLLAQLAALSKHELVVVRAAVERLIGQPATAGPLYDALLAVAGVKMPYGRFQQGKAYKTYVENEKLVTAFIETTWPYLSKVELLSVTHWLVEQLSFSLILRKVPVSVTSLALNLSSIPTVFDNCFPGYRSAGKAYLVLKAMVRS
jgi:hypothetical protein